MNLKYYWAIAISQIPGVDSVPTAENMVYVSKTALFLCFCRLCDNGGAIGCDTTH